MKTIYCIFFLGCHLAIKGNGYSATPVIHWVYKILPFVIYVKTNNDVYLHKFTYNVVYPQIHIVYHEKMFKDIIYFNFHIVYKKHIVGSSAVSPT